ncbi:hypothetical protein [Nocardia jiangsuensis]|uniref:LPXTG-motif cell wall-anchored protein n=1 Tax=Nocardia jiangsuensis TaxID=1691563 RepID=A0ABV8DLY3_9NOCA
MSESAFVLAALAISALALGTALILRLRRPREVEQVTVDELRARLAAESRPPAERTSRSADSAPKPPDSAPEPPRDHTGHAGSPEPGPDGERTEPGRSGDAG